MSTHVNGIGDAFSLVQYPPRDTPLLDENYSPISNVGEVTPFQTPDFNDIMGESNAANNAIEQTPLPIYLVIKEPIYFLYISLGL